ncbi:MAG TPA: hypothetical protein VFB20_01240 [Burkholderiales bacterium]|nr:hypothetical protein [Burkholderiales bacterium]
MTKTEQLNDAIRKIAERANIRENDLFHLTPVSRDGAGIFIMGIKWPEGARLCEEIERVVTGFPSIGDASCVALLPPVVDAVISAARSPVPVSTAVPDRDGPGRAAADRHHAGRCEPDARP